MTIKHIGIYTPGDPGWIQPGSPEHLSMISPSKVAAIMRLSRWESQYSLWHRMQGYLPAEEPKDAYDLGHDIEPFAARRFKRRFPNWRLSRTEVQFVVDPDHFGFPAMVTLDGRASSGSARSVFECKLARDQYDLEKWGDDLTGDLPPDYWTQVLTAMLFTGWTKYPGHLMCLGPNYKERIYPVEYNSEARDEAVDIIEQCRMFWESLQSGVPPELDKHKATYECIKELHPEIDGTTVVLDPDEALSYAQVRADFVVAEDALDLEKNRLLKRMEQAQYAVLGDPANGGIQVARRQAGSKGGVSFYPSKTITPDKVRALTGDTTHE